MVGLLWTTFSKALMFQYIVQTSYGSFNSDFETISMLHVGQKMS